MRFIGVAGQGLSHEMAQFMYDFEVDGFDHIADKRGQVWAAFGVTAQPSYIFINDDGTIVRSIGGMSAEDLGEEIDKLVRS